MDVPIRSISKSNPVLRRTKVWKCENFEKSPYLDTITMFKVVQWYGEIANLKHTRS